MFVVMIITKRSGLSNWKVNFALNKEQMHVYYYAVYVFLNEISQANMAKKMHQGIISRMHVRN
jgi:hypothetical protein